jgi:hypothetical protein
MNQMKLGIIASMQAGVIVPVHDPRGGVGYVMADDYNPVVHGEALTLEACAELLGWDDDWQRQLQALQEKEQNEN